MQNIMIIQISAQDYFYPYDNDNLTLDNIYRDEVIQL